MTARRHGGSGLESKVVVITGAARGLGASLARQLTHRGARIALLGLEPTELAAVSAQCAGSKWWEANVTDSGALNRVAAEVVAHFGRVDILVINAGVASGGPFLHTDAAAFDRTIEVNLLGSVRTLRAFLPHLVVTRGYSLQIASAAALTPAPMMAAYCTSKSGVEAFTESVRIELASRGVDLGTAYLSWTDTDMVRGADERPDVAKARADLPGYWAAPILWSQRSRCSATESKSDPPTSMPSLGYAGCGRCEDCSPASRTRQRDVG